MISYRVPETGRRDRGDGSAYTLADALRARSFSVFLAERNTGGGDIWHDTIQAAVEHCKAFVAVCSPTYGDSEQSQWTKAEAVLATECRKKIIPVWHSGPYPPAGLRLAFTSLHALPSTPDGQDMQDGYRAAGISDAHVADELVATLLRVGVVPSGGGQ